MKFCISLIEPRLYSLDIIISILAPYPKKHKISQSFSFCEILLMVSETRFHSDFCLLVVMYCDGIWGEDFEVVSNEIDLIFHHFYEV